MKSNVWFCAAVLLLGAVHTAAFAQAAQPASGQSATGRPAPGSASLQVPADEVLLDLVVHDRRNRPVLDLRPEQISITDNGAHVALTSLRLMQGKQQEEPLITLLFDRPGIPQGEKSKDESALDGPVTSAQQISGSLRNVAAKVLKGFPASGFQFAVMDIWGRLQLQQEYTGDHKSVIEAVAMAVQPGQYGAQAKTNAVEEKLTLVAKTGQDASGATVSTRQRALARSIYAALDTSGRIPEEQHLSSALASLLALVEAQQSLPGRKAIVYFTSSGNAGSNAAGETSRDSRSKDALRSIIGAANRAGVNIYVVRLDALDTSKEMSSMLNAYAVMSIASANLAPSSATAANPQGVSGLQVARAGQFADSSAFRMVASKQGGVTYATDDLTLLARGTGGDSLNGAESLSKPVKDMVQDLTTYYEATYVPPTGDEDGSFHATAVNTLRAGLRVRTRTGYLALPPNAGITDPPQPFELPLMALLRSMELPGAVNYRAAVLRMGHQQDGNMNLVAVEAPVKELEVREDGSTHLASAHISILADIEDSSGTVIERFSEDIARRWAAGNGADAAPETISFERPFSAPPGAYVLETAVMDCNSGKAAANRQPFEIAAPVALPELSQLVLVRTMEPVEDEDTTPEPLLYGDRRVAPNLYGQLPAGIHRVSVFFLAHTDPQSKEPATVKLEVLHDGVALGGAPLTSTLQGGGEFHPVMNSFSIPSATDGRYQVRATLTQDGKSAVTIGDFAMTADAEPTVGQTETAASDAPLLADPAESANPAQLTDRPAAGEIDRMLADARQNALDYRDKLPNLICEQTTNREEDSHGDGHWAHKDTLVEMLTYVDQQESRTRVGAEEYGARKDADQAVDTGLVSAGEFGEALGGVFKPESKAEFTWKESSSLRGEAVEVFDYRIASANSSFSLKTGSGFATAGYHGRIYIDRATHGVLSITLNTDEVPKDFPIRKAAVRVDYDYVAINDHDYLLPVTAEVVVGQGRQMLERNDLEFSNFRRFGSSLRILTAPPAEKTQ